MLGGFLGTGGILNTVRLIQGPRLFKGYDPQERGTTCFIQVKGPALSHQRDPFGSDNLGYDDIANVVGIVICS